jgi:RNA polymerase sigma factor (sigma-70 family)
VRRATMPRRPVLPLLKAEPLWGRCAITDEDDPAGINGSIADSAIGICCLQSPSPSEFLMPTENTAMATDPVSAEFANGFEKHRAELLRHCYRMLGCFADAEDLVQDTLLRAWRSRATYSGDAPLRHWLMRIATNACLNALDRQRPRRFPQLDIEAATEGAPLQALEAAHWITPAPDALLFPRPDTALELREQVSLAFLALLQRLTPKQRGVAAEGRGRLVFAGDCASTRADVVVR